MNTSISNARIILFLISFAVTSISISKAQTAAQIPATTPDQKTVAAPPPCECKGWSGGPVKIVSPVKTSMAKCGGKDTIKRGSYALTSPNYLCFPSGCMPVYKWNITGTVTGTHIGQTYGFNFSTVGTYTVTITPVCGQHNCPPCIFKVVVMQ